MHHGQSISRRQLLSGLHRSGLGIRQRPDNEHDALKRITDGKRHRQFVSRMPVHAVDRRANDEFTRGSGERLEFEWSPALACLTDSRRPVVRLPRRLIHLRPRVTRRGLGGRQFALRRRARRQHLGRSRRLYPPLVFALAWAHVESLINADRVRSPREIPEEVERYNDDVFKWAKARRQFSRGAGCKAPEDKAEDSQCLSEIRRRVSRYGWLFGPREFSNLVRGLNLFGARLQLGHGGTPCREQVAAGNARGHLFGAT